jgi:hypothetical protein
MMRASHSSKSSLCSGLLGLHHARRGIAGHELGAAAPGEVARELRIPVIPKLTDLIGRPARRHTDQRIGDRAFGKIIELPELAAQPDVHRHQHLLHRRIAIDAVRAHIARAIDNVTQTQLLYLAGELRIPIILELPGLVETNASQPSLRG